MVVSKIFLNTNGLLHSVRNDASLIRVNPDDSSDALDVFQFCH